MSSTTDRERQQGQVLVLFAGAIVVLLAIAALAFDVGMMLVERRDQQNAADAASLAGARYALTSANFHGTCTGAGTNPAVVAACEVVDANGFQDSSSDEDVFVDIPPVHGEYRGYGPGFIEVRIQSTRPSIFGGIIGRAAWPVGSMAVAANQQGVTYAFGMLALNETACKAIHLSGTGQINAASNVQSNSSGEDCGDPDLFGLSRSGASSLNVAAPGVCRSVGDIQDAGGGTMTCVPDPFSFALPDPLRNLPAPAQPALAAAMKEWVTPGPTLKPTPSNIPDYCPGATGTKAPNASTPQICVLGRGGPQKNRVWVLSPGLYPGGIELEGGVTVYLLPGIYWIGGGGFNAAGDVNVITVDDENDRTKAVCTLGATPPCTGGGGVLIYNTKLSTTGAGAAAPITLGGGGATLSLMPYAYPFGDSTIDLVIFQDRAVTLTVTLNGSASQASDVRGIVYVPEGQVKVNGANSVFSMDQVIADTFLINGSGGTVNVLRETGVDALIKAVGLVE